MKEYEQRATKMIMSTVEGVKAQIRKAYNKGYKDGKADTPFTDTEEAEKKAYNRGLNDAWKIVKRIESAPDKGGLWNAQIAEVFGKYYEARNLYNKFSPDEALDLYKRWEDKQKQDAEIKVGDEVVLNANATYENEKAIILTCDESVYPYNVLMSNGDTEWIKKDVIERKTGRHFDQIAEVLAELRGAENDE